MPGETHSTAFGRLLQEYRLRAGLTQEALAEMAGLGRRSVQGLERGENIPHISTLQRLNQALALSPEEGSQLAESARQSLRGRRALPETAASRESSSRAGPDGPLRHNLPVQLTSFIGREREVAEVRTLLTTTRLLTLMGSGGCGKTRLAIQVATDLVASYPWGVWFVDLAPMNDPALVPDAVAHTLEIRDISGRPTLTTLIETLRSRHLLVILDNCEHLIDACAKLAHALLQSCPHLRILATSRERLGVRGETTLRVPSLAVPDFASAPSLDQLRQTEAIRLFVDRAIAVDQGFHFTRDNARVVAQICQRLDGIPLAIELAAARVRVLSVEQIAVRLDDRFRLLTGGSRMMLRRQQTLRAMVDSSHDLLSEKEQTLFRRLAVFAGGWTLEAAEVVCSDGESMTAIDGAVDSHQSLIAFGEVLDLLTSLVDKSLVVVEQATGDRGYHFHETIRVYAAEKLAQANETEAVRERHLAWFLSLAERAEPELLGARQVAWYATLEAERANVRAALEWGFANNRQAAARLAAAIWRFWHTTSEPSDASHLLETALSHVPEPTLTRAKLLLGLVSHIRMPHEPRVKALMDENLALFRELGDPVGSAWALHNLGYVSEMEEDHIAAIRLLEESAALFESAGDRPGLGTSLRDLGLLVAIQAADRERGWQLLEKSRVILEVVGDCWNRGWTLRHLGYLARLKGDDQRAGELAEESLRLFRAIGEYYGTNQVLLDLVKLVESESDLGRAQEILASSLTLMRDVGNTFGMALTICAFGIFAIHRGKPQRGLRLVASGVAEHTLVAAYANQRADIEAGLAAARATMGEEAFNCAWTQGQAMTLEQAVAYALEEDGD